VSASHLEPSLEVPHRALATPAVKALSRLMLVVETTLKA
jgi:hypothetical protein